MSYGCVTAWREMRLRTGIRPGAEFTAWIKLLLYPGLELPTEKYRFFAHANNGGGETQVSENRFPLWGCEVDIDNNENFLVVNNAGKYK